MNWLTHRPYTGETDLPLIADLLDACEEVDRLEQTQSVDELRRMLTEPDLDPARDVALWPAADGGLAGYGRLWIAPDDGTLDSHLHFAVHPTARSSALAAAIIGWAEALLADLGRQRGRPATLRSGARADHAERLSLLAAHGFRPVRHFLTMERNLTEPIPEPAFPPGFGVRPADGPAEAAAWVALFNESFIDHYNHHDVTVEQFQHWLTDPICVPELNLVATSPDGTLVGFCWGLINLAENSRTGRNEGWIGLLGTRRGYRRLGLGRALLLTGLRRLRAAGVTSARLGVDADSPTGATRLYDTVGFQTVNTWITHAITLTPPEDRPSDPSS